MKQKIEILIVLSLFIFIPFYGQNKNNLNEMINNSIESVVEIHQGFVQKGILEEDDFNTHYILRDNLPLNFIVSDNITRLNQKNVFSKDIPLKELKKGVFCYSFSYFVLDNDMIRIHVITKKIKITKKTLENILIDGFTFTYQYFCNERKWRLIDSKPKLQ